MNKIIIILMAAMTVCATATAKSKSPARKLINRLCDLQKRGTLIGHQDALFYGTTWKWEFGRSDINDVCGDYPAVLGCDLGGIEHGNDRNLDGVPFDKMREQIIDFAQKGGIVTISWHADNPANGGNAWNVDAPAVAQSLPGGALHAKMTQWIARTIDFIKSLKDSNGRPIPVIFRPWHEMTGSWFWWGTPHCTAKEYQSLFRMVVRQFRKARIDNVVWSYSPGADAHDTPQRFFNAYPGDRYVDMLGFDIYQYNGPEEFVATCRLDLKIMHDYAQKHRKLYAITETGYRNTPDEKWFTNVLRPAYQGFSPCYVLLWRNAWDQKEENFGPAPEKSCAEDFRLFHKDDATLFLNDIRN